MHMVAVTLLVALESSPVDPSSKGETRHMLRFELLTYLPCLFLSLSQVKVDATVLYTYRNNSHLLIK